MCMAEQLVSASLIFFEQLYFGEGKKNKKQNRL